MQLAADGLEVTLVPSAGSIANIEALTAEDGQVALAFVQSGVEKLFDGETSKLRALGTLYYEPIWLFYNRRHLIQFVSDLEGKRVAVGQTGSGTNAVAELLLEAYDLKPMGLKPLVDVFEMEMNDAVEALENYELDAAFFVLPPIRVITPLSPVAKSQPVYSILRLIYRT